MGFWIMLAVIVIILDISYEVQKNKKNKED